MRFRLTRGDAFLAEWVNDARAAGPRRCGGLRMRRFLQGTGSHAASPGSPTRGRGPTARSGTGSGSAAAPAAAQPAPPPAAPGQMPPEALEALVSPIALFPDPLLGQVLEASLRPQEVAEAAAFLKANPGLTGKSLESALQGKSWNDSVKALAALPDVLRMLSDHTDWARDLGTAYKLQRDSVLFAVQQMRGRAMEAGNLKSNARADGEGGAGGDERRTEHHLHRAGAAPGRVRAGLQPHRGVRHLGLPDVPAAAGVPPGLRRRRSGDQLQHRRRHRLELLAVSALSAVSTAPAVPPAAAARLEVGTVHRHRPVEGERGRRPPAVEEEEPARPRRLARSQRGPAAEGRRPRRLARSQRGPAAEGRRPRRPARSQHDPGGGGTGPTAGTQPARPGGGGTAPTAHAASRPPAEVTAAGVEERPRQSPRRAATGGWAPAPRRAPRAAVARPAWEPVDVVVAAGGGAER